MKRLISIAVAVLAIGAATPEAKAESVADEVIAMCTRNKANERICEFWPEIQISSTSAFSERMET
tara:strand:- start:660 stop:854 length:195 start_codon:yes stop_codon:yes gene_type:complete